MSHAVVECGTWKGVRPGKFTFVRALSEYQRFLSKVTFPGLTRGLADAFHRPKNVILPEAFLATLQSALILLSDYPTK